MYLPTKQIYLLKINVITFIFYFLLYYIVDTKKT